MHRVGKDTKVNGKILCDACNAVVLELFKKLPNPAKAKESDVYSALDRLCVIDNFRSYAHIPPTMVRACTMFLDKHGEGLEDRILAVSGQPAAEAATSVCEQELLVCPGTDEVLEKGAKGKKKTKKPIKSKSKSQSSKERKRKPAKRDEL